MKETFAHRLKTARMIKGISQVELAQQLAVSKQAVSKYEHGQMLPDSGILIKMSRILGQKPDFFTRPMSVGMEAVDFRKKSVLQGKNLAAVKARIADEIERYLELEEILGIRESFNNPLADFKLMHIEDVEAATSYLSQCWHLGSNPLPNVVEMLEHHTIKVVEIDAPLSFDGLSTIVKNDVPVIVLNKNFDVVRKRFTALHELGHLMMKLPEDISAKETEAFCNRFAGSMLIPKAILLKELGAKRYSISVNELIKIKESYGISIAALVYRACDLRIITESSAKRFWKFRNESVKRQKEIGWGFYKGQETSGRFEQLLYKALAEELISWSKAASIANTDMEILRKKFQTF